MHLEAGLEIERNGGYNSLASDDAAVAMRSYLDEPIERRRGVVRET